MGSTPSATGMYSRFPTYRRVLKTRATSELLRLIVAGVGNRRAHESTMNSSQLHLTLSKIELTRVLAWLAAFPSGVGDILELRIIGIAFGSGAVKFGRVRAVQVGARLEAGGQVGVGYIEGSVRYGINLAALNGGHALGSVKSCVGDEGNGGHGAKGPGDVFD